MATESEIGRSGASAPSGHSAEPEPCSTVSAVPASVLNASGHVYAASHNDFWNKHQSNFGQYFVGRVRVGAAAYDSQYDPVVWMPKNSFCPGTDKHREMDAHLSAMAQAIAKLFNSGDFEPTTANDLCVPELARAESAQ